jgi:mannosyl-oligosaccharide alpha-1,2-mannosidase
LAVAVVVTFSLYHLTQIRNWDTHSIGGDGLKKLGHNVATTSPATSALGASSTRSVDLAVPTAGLGISLRRQSSHQPTHTQSSTLLDVVPVLATSTPIRSSEQAQATAQGNDHLAVNDTERLLDEEDISEAFGSHGQGRLEIDPQIAILEKPHWIPQKEHFPVPSESLIQLPTGQPKQIPAIQHAFSSKDSIARKDNEKKLGAIKEAFKHAWSGYKTYAMPHDELAPVSRDFLDPFNGWGATLVDTLDTLWIMDLKDDFELAVAEVKKIDFATSIRKDIPLFETVIRYLGGLVAAYDLSLAKYPVLLDKAVELAEILMGAFDTPNRMPITYYHWAPSYASQPHRAASKVVLAELGSLSLEFTRLAQITKDNKYYDAIARITNELESWQNNTKLPGLWPVSVDASGCKKPDRMSVQMAHSASHGPQELLPPVQNSPTLIVDRVETSSQAQDHFNSSSSHVDPLERRQLDDSGILNGEEPAQPPSDRLADGNTSPSTLGQTPKDGISTMDGVECQHQGLASPPYSSLESFTIGGMSDSAYEYLPKEWLLLGGLKDQYESMHKNAMDAIRDNLLFRPMTKTGRDILFAGTLKKTSLAPHGNETEPLGTMEYDGQHLTCFAGGMFALGAKIFGIKDDLEIAHRLTDGCVWAYESTTTGIMPESFHMVPCNNRKNCMWNETKWWEALDPYSSIRDETVKTWYEQQKILGQETLADEAERPLHANMPVPPTYNTQPDAEHNSIESDSTTSKSSSESTLRKRQPLELGESSDLGEETPVEPTRTQTGATEGQDDDDVHTMPQPLSSSFTPKAPASHEEYVRARIKEERLPPGFADISSKKYILRPEAIESVFIMYRVTGDKYWQEQGWKMFTAIQTYTLTEHAHSAISDVTSEVPPFLDSMESFWLAETLKYFYLLYSDPDLISLDDYVL